MKNLYLLTISIFAFISASAQLDFDIELEEVTIDNLYGVQSYAVGSYNGDWFILGGRTDGLHQRQPFAAFAAAENHTNVLRVNPSNNSFSQASILSLPLPLKEQLQSTNLSFRQVNDLLYIIGGYGYSTTAADHKTYPVLTVVNLADLASKMDNNQDISSAFSFVESPTMAVTGGYLGFLNDTFYLIGGQEFNGRYNPMGPTHGPGFFQQYTEEIRKFQVANPTTNPTLVNYHAIKDSDYLHRRDYNVAPQIFPDGSMGFTAFSGVFKKTVDLPWEDGVDIREQGYQHRADMVQKLSQYHSAKLPIYDPAEEKMYTMFFGGIAQYFYANGSLTSDPNVPFVKTISYIERDKNDSLKEYSLTKEMPGYLGAGAEFIPIDAAFFDDQEILHLDKVSDSKTLVGYIFGGIESTGPNIFFSNTGTQSGATSKIFAVYVNKGGATSVRSVPPSLAIELETGLEIEENVLRVNVKGVKEEKFDLEIFNMRGKLVYKKPVKTRDLPYDVPLDEISCKMGIVRAQGKDFAVSTKIIFR